MLHTFSDSQNKTTKTKNPTTTKTKKQPILSLPPKKSPNKQQQQKSCPFSKQKYVQRAIIFLVALDN